LETAIVFAKLRRNDSAFGHLRLCARGKMFRK